MDDPQDSVATHKRRSRQRICQTEIGHSTRRQPEPVKYCVLRLFIVNKCVCVYMCRVPLLTIEQSVILRSDQNELATAPPIDAIITTVRICLNVGFL